MRQDAVMEQVFDLVNKVLNSDRETKRRDLKVRRYKVIPLAAQAGLLEFVNNTTPLQEWLFGAHPRSVPQQICLQLRPYNVECQVPPSRQEAQTDERSNRQEPTGIRRSTYVTGPKLQEAAK